MRKILTKSELIQKLNDIEWEDFEVKLALGIEELDKRFELCE